MDQKQFRVSGVNEDGDVMAFETDSEERARTMHSDMSCDLDEVTWSVRGEGGDQEKPD